MSASQAKQLRSSRTDAPHEQLDYLKLDAQMPERREVDPYVVAYAQGKWYAVTWDRGSRRVYRADDEIDVTVRYSARVARWLIERGEGEVQDDGSVRVAHTVAGPGWIVRQVLQYGPDAEVVAPAEVQGWVGEAVQ